MLVQNDVLEYVTAPDRAIRVLWIDVEHALAYTYELRCRAAVPSPAPLRALRDEVASGRARRLLVDPCAAPAPPDTMPAGYLALQAKAWSAVRALHADRRALYDPRRRAALVAAYASAHGISKSSILRYLRRFWERGQTPDALLPDYGNSGAPGRTRAVTAGIKRGRPRKDAGTGLNADERIRAIFRAAAARYAASHDDFSRRAAYRMMLEHFFQDQEPNAVPTFGQFSYWLERDGSIPAPACDTTPEGAARTRPAPASALARFAQQAA